MRRMSCVLLLGLWSCWAMPQYWAGKLTGPGSERITDLKVGTGDALYTIGDHESVANLAGTSVPWSGLRDVVVARMDATGAVLWTAHASGPGLDLAGKLCPTADGAVVVCGQYSGTANVFGTTLNAQGGGTDLFVAKLNAADGTAQWVRTGGGALFPDRAAGIAAAPDGSVVVTGEFRGTAVFDAGTFTSTIDPNTNQPGSDVFVMRYTADGAASWFKHGAAPLDDQAVDVGVDDAGRVYACGVYSGTLDFGVPHAGTALNQVYVVRFAPDGTEDWFRRLGNASFQRAADMQVSGDGTWHLCGDVQGQLTFYDDAPDALLPAQPQGTFLIRADAAGQFLSAVVESSDNPVTADALVVSDAGVAVLGTFTCSFTAMADHYAATGLFIAVGTRDLYVSRYASGTLVFQEAQQFGGHAGKWAGGIDRLSSGALLLSGWFEELLIFPGDGGGWGEDLPCAPVTCPTITYCGDPHYTDFESIASGGQSDGFVARGYVEDREPYDAFCRSGTECDRSWRDLLVAQAVDDPTDTVVVCDKAIITWDRNVPRPAYPSSGCPTSSTISWDITAAWSDGGIEDTMEVHQTGTYWRTHTSSNGCYYADDTIHVIILPAPHAWITIDGQQPPLLGPLSTVDLCAAAWLAITGQQPGDQWQWTVNGTAVPGDSVLADVSGNYALTVTAQNGCTATHMVTVTLFANTPLPNVTGVEAVFYNGAMPLDLQDTLSFCGQDCVYGLVGLTWYIDGAPGQLAQPYFLTFNTTDGCYAGQVYADQPVFWSIDAEGSGWYPLNVHIDLHVEGCTDDSLSFDVQDSVYLLLGQAPVLDAPDELAVCAGDTAVIVASCTDCTSVEWSGPGILALSPGMDTAWVNVFGLYNVQAFNNSGGALCADVADILVVPAGPPPLFMDPAWGIICAGDSALLYTDPGYAHYDWTGPSGPLGVDDDSVLVAQVGAYFLTVSTASGCALTNGPIMVQQYGSPSLAAFPDNILCNGGSAVLQVSGGFLESVEWAPPLSGNGAEQVVNSPGTYSCTVTSCGQVFQLTIDVLAGAAEATIAGGPFVLCGDPVLLVASPGAAAYLWTPGGGTNDSLSVTTPGIYQVSVTDSIGCTATSDPVMVDQYAFADPLEVEDYLGCMGMPVTLSASGSGMLVWSVDPAQSDTLAVGPTVTLPGDAGSFTLYVSQADSVCSGPVLAVPVQLASPPSAPVISGEDSLCIGDPLQFSVWPQPGVSFAWTTPQGPVVGSSVAVGAAGPEDEGNYTVTATVPGCPPEMATASLIVAAPPGSPQLSGPATACEGEPVLFAVTLAGEAPFVWSTPGGPVLGPTVLSFTATAGTAGNYTVTVDGGPCPDAAAAIALVVEDCAFIVPNVFTPDGDGVNEAWTVELPAGSTGTARFFNRWGQPVAEVSGSVLVWRGRNGAGDALPDGVYFFVLNVERAAGAKELTGYVQLLRGR